MLDKKIKAKLLLHACCAPCLTSSFDQLRNDYDVTVFWFNPNIFPKNEYDKRLVELKKYAEYIKVKLITDDHYLEDNLSWNFMTNRFESEKEGGNRCKICIRYRLLETVKIAQREGFDFFATTLTVSPHKNSAEINKIGKDLADKFSQIQYLETDFKKNDGYKNSIEICREHNIYRQKYCGCQYSLR